MVVWRSWINQNRFVPGCIEIERVCRQIGWISQGRLPQQVELIDLALGRWCDDLLRPEPPRRAVAINDEVPGLPCASTPVIGLGVSAAAAWALEHVADLDRSDPPLAHHQVVAGSDGIVRVIGEPGLGGGW